MYDMYPEWGPARHAPESGTADRPLQEALDRRDDGGQRPDDS